MQICPRRFPTPIRGNQFTTWGAQVAVTDGRESRDSVRRDLSRSGRWVTVRRARRMVCRFGDLIFESEIARDKK